jgi:hypothetical protein
MGRGPLQIIWCSISMAIGIWGGRKLAKIFFFNEELKYKIWEETEIAFWKANGYPKHLEAKVEFESVLNPGSMFRSYLPENGIVSVDEVLDKYDNL